MESRDLPPDDNNPGGLRTRAGRRTSLHLDASKFELATKGEPEPASPREQPPPTPSTGASLASASATAPGRPRALTQGASSVPGPSLQMRHRAATVANPPKSAPPGGSTAPEKEKRKRSRVTPEQLAHLERIFAVDKSPTAAKRKEISEMLGMQERQTQIWFQNRRAKAKTLEGKGRSSFRGSPPSGPDSPPDTPPDFGPPPDVDLHTLIHEDEPVSFIPCSDLSIGSWRRISATLGQHDLLAYVSAAKRCFTWFIYSNGYGFKMEIPFDSIASTSLTGASPGQGLASFFLSRPPLFYLESIASPTSPLASGKTWKKCADWTEGQQASKVLRHDLIGAALPLVNALKTLPSSAQQLAAGGAPGVSAGAFAATDAMPPMHIPQPPMAGLDPPFAAGTLSHFLHGRKRSFSGPPALAQASHDMPPFSLLGDPQAGTSEAQSSFPSVYSEQQRTSSISFPPEYSTSLFRAFPPPAQPPPPPAPTHQPHSSLGDFSTVPIAHAAAARPFSASSVDTRFPPFDTSQTEHPGQFGTSAMATSSPTLLTSAFDPARLHRDVRLAPPDPSNLEMDASRFGASADEPGPPSAPHDTSFDATVLAMAPQDPPQSAP